MAKTSKNIEIEALRCFAVVIVACGHSHNLMPWHEGLMTTRIGFWTGVDLFLCISGFVITKAFSETIRSAAGRGRTAWWNETSRFLVRRAFRLMPAALFWIVAAYALSHLFNRSGAFGSPAQNLQDAVAILLSVANIYFAACTVGLLSNCGPNAIYWTVSLEQQFYLLFPILILFKNTTILAICLAVFVLFAVLPKNVWVYYDRADTLAIGVAIGLFSETQAYRSLIAIPSVLPRLLAPTILLGFLLFGPPGLNGVGLFPIVLPLVSMTCGLIVLLASYERGFLFAGGRGTDWMRIVGERSFSIYLTHNLAMAATTETFTRLFPATVRDGNWDVPMVAVAVAILAIFAEASYRLIEIPLRSFGKAHYRQGFASALR